MKNKTTKEVLNLSNAFAFQDQHSVKRVRKMNHVSYFIDIVISESYFKHKDSFLEVMGFIDDTSMKVIDEDIDDTEHEISNLSVASLQMLCLGKLYNKKMYHEKRSIETINRENLLMKVSLFKRANNCSLEKEHESKFE